MEGKVGMKRHQWHLVPVLRGRVRLIVRQGKVTPNRSCITQTALSVARYGKKWDRVYGRTQDGVDVGITWY